ncbi:MAG: protein kinase [Planctomycetota bacterium]
MPRSGYDTAPDMRDPDSDETLEVTPPEAGGIPEPLLRDSSHAELPTRLGPYLIEGELGRGGMGVVYVAEDTRLERRVAIKLLPEAVARDPEALASFQREAKLLASLSHPNIATIHSLEKVGEHPFFTLELIPGKTLLEHIAGRPLPLAEALSIAHQIALALEAAHGNGVIHCDLKPPNIKVTPEGHVKVLDFGIAQVLGKERQAPVESVLGTPGYMSPEQLLGEAVDARTDIWSLGCLLYECVTGRRAFVGKDLEESVNATLHKEPDWELLPQETPPRLRELLLRCLVKEPRERLSSAEQVRASLEAAGAGGKRQFKDIEETVSETLHNALKVGDPAPRFDLLNSHGQRVRSKELLQKEFLVVTFYRGSW